MSKIVYKKNADGSASDLRFVKKDHILEQDELFIEGDNLPDINTLHSEEYRESEKTKKQKKNSIEGDINTIINRNKGKDVSQVSDEDALEFVRLLIIRGEEF